MEQEILPLAAAKEARNSSSWSFFRAPLYTPLCQQVRWATRDSGKQTREFARGEGLLLSSCCHHLELLVQGVPSCLGKENRGPFASSCASLLLHGDGGGQPKGPPFHSYLLG